MKRRRFIAESLLAGAGLMAARQLPNAHSQTANTKGDAKMPFQQPALPYALDALKPFLSEEQVKFHYQKHHAGYFKKLNALVEGKPEADMTLREVVLRSTGGVFNNAAQAWNHGFYWDCMSPDGGGEPKGKLADAIRRDFDSFKSFRDAMSEAAVTLFGSGWCWLAADKEGKLHVMPLGNADTPLKHAREPVLTIDVWEHAYYIDYRNERAKYVDGFWNVVNWDFAEKVFGA